jgi:hypothetical protein
MLLKASEKTSLVSGAGGCLRRHAPELNPGRSVGELAHSVNDCVRLLDGADDLAIHEESEGTWLPIDLSMTAKKSDKVVNSRSSKNNG